MSWHVLRVVELLSQSEVQSPRGQVFIRPSIPTGLPVPAGGLHLTTVPYRGSPLSSGGGGGSDRVTIGFLVTSLAKTLP